MCFGMRRYFWNSRNQGKIVFKGTGFNSIRHFKNEVESIEEGKECGIQIKGFTVNG